MQTSLKQYLKPVVATALFFAVGFWIDEEFWPAGVAIGLFWLLLTLFAVRRRNNPSQQVP
jgi:hypothetical protein